VDIGETSTLPLILPQPFVFGEWHITPRFSGGDTSAARRG